MSGFMLDLGDVRRDLFDAPPLHVRLPVCEECIEDQDVEQGALSSTDPHYRGSCFRCGRIFR